MATSLLSVSKQFVHSYYKILHTSPQELHRFYKEGSSFTTGSESTYGSPDETVTGLEGITDKIQQLNFQNCRVTLSVVDAQSATQGGILILVVGHLSNNNESPRKFLQTFLLAEQSSTTNKGYYVHNDIFRYLEEGQEDEHEESVESPQPEHVKPAQQSLPEVTKPKESKPAAPEETPAPKTQKEVPQQQEQPAKPTPAPVAAAPVKVQEELPKSSVPAKPTLWASIASKTQTEQPTTTPAIKPAAPTQQAPQKAASAPVPARKEEKQGNPSLFVSNVPFSATEDQVRSIFAKFGEIKSLSVNTNKGLAFIDMANPDVALRAIDAGRNGELAMEGRTLKVEEKKPKPSIGGGFKGDQRGPRTDNKPRGERTGDRGDRVNGKASAPRDQKRQ